MEISIETEISRFYTFLNEEGNDRIIFSGKFGIGKTYFLDKFFNTNHLNEYLEIYISPVNYSVATNEDIFEYIKINILFELLEKLDCNLEKIEIDLPIAIQYYVFKNMDDVLFNILSIGEKIKTGTNFTSILIKLRKKLLTKINEFKEPVEKDDWKDIKGFVDSLSTRQGSIYENDIITQLIRSIINDYKIENKKPIVLVIDDLDRIDPEHIFRIMNIFSAHQCFCGTKEQKFGIDKTILVCDIDNLRRIFFGHHGQDVDFCGYIDKFYSKEIYHFDNLNSIFNSIDKILETTKAGKNPVNAIYYDEWRELLNEIIKELFQNKKISIRSFLKVQNKDFNIRRVFCFEGSRYINSNCPGVFLFDVLRLLFPNFDEMKCSIDSIDVGLIESDDYIVKIFIFLADLKNGISHISGEYLGCNYEVNSYDLNSFMAKIKADDKIISQTKLIQDAFSNYVKHCQ